jgi:hypothetical protein
MLTFAPLMQFSQSALFLVFSFQFLMLHLLKYVNTQLHLLFFGSHTHTHTITHERARARAYQGLGLSICLGFTSTLALHFPFVVTDHTTYRHLISEDCTRLFFSVRTNYSLPIEQGR